MERNRDDEPRTADEVREKEEEHQVERTAKRDLRHPNDPIGDTAYGGDLMLPPTGDLKDPPPTTGLPGEPPHDPGDEER
jgi:hypothetical protein